MVDLNRKIKERTARLLALGLGLATLAAVLLIDYPQAH